MSAGLPSVLGKGILVIWSDLDLTREDEFDAWHIHEHLPERVKVPGFLRARRYVKSAPPPAEGAELLTLYETENVDVMASAPYLERLNNPTPLTRATVPLMERMRRSALRLSASLGQGIGGHLSAWQFRPPTDDVEKARDRLGTVLADALAEVGVVAAHLYEPEIEATNAKDATTEGKATRTVADLPRWLILIEAIHERGLAEAQHAVVDDLTGISDDGGVTMEGYRLGIVLEGPAGG